MNSFFYFILFYFLYFLFYLFCLSFLDFKIIDYKLNNNNFNLSDSDYYYEFILLNDGLI